MKTGWCTAIGAAQHAACRRPETCSCECHRNGESLSTEGRKVLAMSAQRCENSPTNQDGPGGSQRELQAVVPGPRRSVEGTD